MSTLGCLPRMGVICGYWHNGLSGSHWLRNQSGNDERSDFERKKTSTEHKFGPIRHIYTTLAGETRFYAKRSKESVAKYAKGRVFTNIYCGWHRFRDMGLPLQASFSGYWQS